MPQNRSIAEIEKAIDDLSKQLEELRKELQAIKKKPAQAVPKAKKTVDHQKAPNAIETFTAVARQMIQECSRLSFGTKSGVLYLEYTDIASTTRVCSLSQVVNRQNAYLFAYLEPSPGLDSAQEVVTRISAINEKELRASIRHCVRYLRRKAAIKPTSTPPTEFTLVDEPCKRVPGKKSIIVICDRPQMNMPRGQYSFRLEKGDQIGYMPSPCYAYHEQSSLEYCVKRSDYENMCLLYGKPMYAVRYADVWPDATWGEDTVLSRNGYTVRQDSGLSAKQRQEIIDYIIGKNKATPKEIRSLLSGFIYGNENRPSMSNAVSKWKVDLAYLKKKYSI